MLNRRVSKINFEYRTLVFHSKDIRVVMQGYASWTIKFTGKSAIAE